MFRMTQEWLKTMYGSKPNQVQETKDWLDKYGVNVPPELREEWAWYKHLAEYQINTNDIVIRAVASLGSAFISELSAHRFINLMRVPGAESYEHTLKMVQPQSILELGVGGDSAISTSVFLYYAEQHTGFVVSVDRNPLGMTWERYKNNKFWLFIQGDSLDVMRQLLETHRLFDMVFIDSIHSYTHTKKELEFAEKLAMKAILLDDITFEGNDFDPEPGGVKRALDEWTTAENLKLWQRIDFDTVSVLIRNPKQEGELL